MRTILVTGASGNLGQGVIKKFLAEGFHVTGTLVPNDPVGIDIKNEHFEGIVVDLMDEEAAAGLVNAIISKRGNLDVAVLTVGGFVMGGIADTGIGDIRQQIRLNFETAYHVARPVFLQMLKQKKGRIFLIGSRPGSDMRNSKGMVAYGLSKSLIFRLAELMNEEAKGIDVVTSVIAPSTIDTPQNRRSMPDADFSKWVTPEAIAAVIHFYASDAAGILREPVIKVYGNG